MNQADSLLLHRWQVLQTKSSCRNLQRAMRYIHANDFCKGLIVQKLPQQPALAAPKVQNALRAAATKCCHYCSSTLFSQTDRLFNCFLFARVSFGDFIRRRLFLTDQATQRLTRKLLPVLQVAICNQFALGMLAQPALAVT